MKKETHIALLFPLLQGKEVNVWLGTGKTPYLKGKVERWTGSYIVFEWLKVIHSDVPYPGGVMLNNRFIKKIQISETQTFKK